MFFLANIVYPQILGVIQIKRNLEPKIEAMLSQQLSFNQIEVEYKGYLKKGLTAIQNLRHLFDNAHINGKQDIIRSTLKENGVFSEGKVRTEKLNRLIMLITYGDGAHRGGKKQKGSNYCSLSAIVPQTGLEPVRPRRHRILSPACLPIPPPGHYAFSVYHPDSYRNQHTVAFWFKNKLESQLSSERRVSKPRP